MRLTDYFIRRKVQSLGAVATARKHNFCALKEAKHILVLYHAADQEVVEPCLETLRMLHKEVQACIYVSGTDVPEVPDTSYTLVQARTDLDIWYMPQEAIIKQFNSLRADILIDLTSSDCYVMQYLMLLHPSTFKVGIKRNNIALHDLAITVTDADGIKHLFGHILFYLQTIRSK